MCCYDVEGRTSPVAGPPANDDGFEEEDAREASAAAAAARAVAGARLSPAQRRALADAYAEYERATRLCVGDWRGAAARLHAQVEGGRGGGDAGAATAALEAAVAGAHVARHVLCVTVLRVATPRQLASMAVDLHPGELRLSLLASACRGDG
jgi:hypothetical protein